MTLNNINIIENFLSSKSNETLLVNSVSQEIGCFYETVIKNLSNKTDIKLKNNEYSKDNKTSSNLFENNKEIYIYYMTSSKQISEVSKMNFSKIIFTDYKNYKKFLNDFITINGYNFNEDIYYFLYNYLKIENQNLINFCKSQPHLTFSELTKYFVNDIGYKKDTSILSKDNFILEIRKSVFNLKRSEFDMKNLFLRIKDEVKYKKFSFLIY